LLKNLKKDMEVKEAAKPPKKEPLSTKTPEGEEEDFSEFEPGSVTGVDVQYLPIPGFDRACDKTRTKCFKICNYLCQK
jgi:hypothetical protein